MKRLFPILFVLALFWPTAVKCQLPELSENAEISIITIGPGKNLYDKFGHTAIRVKDSLFDIAFNYGVYDFSTPNFYTKFARGKLLYILDVRRFDQFVNVYKRQNRWVKEQVLDLSFSEKQEFYDFLENNAKVENRAYLYDFLFDNCATKPRDVLSSVLGDAYEFDESFVKNPATFRELIQQNVHYNTWGSLGMDVAIGAVTDRTASPWEHQFLPNYVYEAAAKARLNRNGNSVPLVNESRTLFENDPAKEEVAFFSSPLFVFGVLALLILWVTFRDYRSASRSRFLDSGIFAISGLIGIILLLLWFGTDHSTTANNYNLLWAFAPSILFAFAIGKKQPKKWLYRYMVLLILMLLLLALHSVTGVQRFAIGFVPLFIALGVRYLYVASYLKKLS
ncbi:DUF4105 domain-containing protein [Aureisphaera galaxeae]|uniref:lipoprotein N-acyltransferase Lnb domain-containing protein n=1 Tax=Aureisphaera galaxeae TaxID=1538023 RepID=UPI00235032B1|nr:DUF4105 domain-containing protein [Aureisphaera galaxeae]MDC8006313.1 DUF4105 domain-containing protein [Aureisphaera galaxeae]